MKNDAIQSGRPILEFGSNYLPHVDRVRDFFPHWIEPVWTPELVVRDMKILRSLGARWMRYHILPISYEKDSYPGTDADQYRELVPHCLRTARSLGMKTHVDLHTDDFESLDVNDVLQRLAEFGGENVDAIQIINEYFYLWNREENREREQEILQCVRQGGFKGNLFFDAGGSVHRAIRETHPALASHVKSVLPMHHYAANAEWDEFAIELFLDLLTGGSRVGKDELSPERRSYYEKMMQEQFGCLAESLRVMEINMVGFHHGAALVKTDRGRLWPELMRRIATETSVNVVSNWCFRDKTSWREYGSHPAMLYPSELPRPEAEVFRRTAMAMMPGRDVYSAFEIRIDSLDERDAAVTILNKTARPVSGMIVAHDGSSLPIHLSAWEQGSLTVSSERLASANGKVRHLLAEFVPDNGRGWEGRCIGWQATTTPAEPSLRHDVRFTTGGTRYPDGIEPVEAFLKQHRDQLAILVEQPAGPETELAIRLQTAITEAWGVLPEVASLTLGAANVLRDRPLILLGTCGQNSVIRCIEHLIDDRYVVSGLGATISAHPGLFQRRPVRPAWPSSSWMHMIGDVVFNPGAVLVLATSFECLREAAHDLIQRICPPGVAAQAYGPHNHPEASAGISIHSRRRFGVDLPRGDFHCRVALGSNRRPGRHRTHLRIERTGLDQTVETSGGIEWADCTVQHPGGTLILEVEPVDGVPACLAAMVISDRGTGARLFKCYFDAAVRVSMDYEGYLRVGDGTRLGASVSEQDWQDMRSGENDDIRRSLRFGWL